MKLPKSRLVNKMTRKRSRASAKKAGTAWESEIVRTLRERGWPHAERRAKTGRNDQGDITGIPGICIEAKNTKQITLAQFANEVRAETQNARADFGAAWIKRPRFTQAKHGYVLMDGDTFMRLIKQAGY